MIGNYREESSNEDKKGRFHLRTPRLTLNPREKWNENEYQEIFFMLTVMRLIRQEKEIEGEGLRISLLLSLLLLLLDTRLLYVSLLILSLSKLLVNVIVSLLLLFMLLRYA